MTNLSKGRYALAISDRSGMQFPYNEMVREWNGAFVHISEYEPKQPQLDPIPTPGDPRVYKTLDQIELSHQPLIYYLKILFLQLQDQM